MWLELVHYRFCATALFSLSCFDAHMCRFNRSYSDSDNGLSPARPLSIGAVGVNVIETWTKIRKPCKNMYLEMPSTKRLWIKETETTAALERHHMRLMVNQITDSSTVYSTFCWSQEHGNIKIPRYWPFVMGIHLWSLATYWGLITLSWLRKLQEPTLFNSLFGRRIQKHQTFDVYWPFMRGIYRWTVVPTRIIEALGMVYRTAYPADVKWYANGRPREGHIFYIWKSTKKAFRKFYRHRCGTSVNLRFNKINALFSRGRSIWNLLKTKTKPPRLNVDIQDLANHFNNITTEDGCLDNNQISIRNEVLSFYRSFKDNVLECDLLGSTIRENIGKLKHKCAPGVDGVTTEHMLFALSDTFCTELASVYSHMFKYNAVPDVLQIGIIVPILKKSTLPSNDYNNFRPITLSTVHAKLVELIILPMVNLDIGGNQYGYQTGKGTEFCCALLNDSVTYFNEGGSAVYMCTLDAVKCFDNIWHEGLFYKLMSRMCPIYWRLLYKSMRATIRLNNEYSQFLSITKGTRQGRVLSPHLFNVFIDDLMRDLQGCPYGLRIGSLQINTAGYADDVTLIASTQLDLQKLVDICYRYSCKWRFSFGPSKSKCIIMRNRSMSLPQPDIWLGTSKLQFVDRVEILGRVFSYNLSSQDHISSRMQSSRRAMFGMGIACSNEAIIPSVKAYLWKSVGVPSLVYALGTCNLNQSDLKLLESFQGTMIKNSLYLGKRCHHSAP